MEIVKQNIAFAIKYPSAPRPTGRNYWNEQEACKGFRQDICDTMTTNRIEMLSGGRFISHHLGAEIYHDSRHQVIKVNYSSGGFGELIKELQPDGSWRKQMLATVGPGDQRSIIEYAR
jgi:hypothetical protein